MISNSYLPVSRAVAVVVGGDGNGGCELSPGWCSTVIINPHKNNITSIIG